VRERILTLFLKRIPFDTTDYVILRWIKEGNINGTLDLAKKIKIAPKNLIRRQEKHKVLKLITIKNEATKPKGRKRVFELTKRGVKILKKYERILRC